MKLRKLSLLAVGLLFGISVYANTSTILTITKTTTLTGQDADEFMKTFGDSFNDQNSPLHFSCNLNDGCTIASTKEGLSGEIAKELLHGRMNASFTSHDHRFTLECGNIPVDYCNVIQHDAVLR